jgi:hypothetical protein
MRKISNTARQYPPGHPALILGDGYGQQIEAMEAEGQQQLVMSDRLPTDIDNRAAFEALGFTFGDPDPSDPMFMPATLPQGWKREGSDHAMWSYIVDEHGRKRVSIFYKAAYYDRSAHMGVQSLCWHVTQLVEYDGPALIFDGQWCTREAVAAEMTARQGAALKEAANFRRYSQDQGRDKRNRASCLETAERYEGTAALYAAALTGLQQEQGDS